jgi:CBS domain-containing protein
MSEKKMIRVCDAMKKTFATIDGMGTIAQALVMMRKFEQKSIIVNRRHENDEYGILLISDIARKVLAVDRAPERVNIYEIMAKPVVGVNPDMDIRYCARLFDRLELTRAPVIENTKVVGMVSFTDLVLKGLCGQN